jgi:cytochrome c-type biogenesis protein
LQKNPAAVKNRRTRSNALPKRHNPYGEQEEDIIDWIARLLTWMEPYLAWGLGLLEEGSLVGTVLAVPAGIALGLSPLTYPLVPVVMSYAAGGNKSTKQRTLVLSSTFALGITTVYVVLGVLFGLLGLALLSFLNSSIGLWYAIAAPFLWIMGLRSLGLLSFAVPLRPRFDPESGRRRGVLGAYLLGLPFGLVGCPSCALIMPSLLIAVAASGSPLVGALAMLGLGLGQGIVLVAAGVFGGALARLSSLAPYRLLIERSVGVVLLFVAAYFTWRALLWL